MAKLPGSLWVEGQYLHFVDGYNREWSYTGFFLKYVTAVPGSIWIDPTSGYLQFIDESGTVCLQLPYVYSRLLTETNARPGSIWIENSLIHYTIYKSPTGNYKIQGHWDVPTDSSHSDGHDDYAHTDLAHTDTAHIDLYGQTHIDYHYDVPHTDHTDTSHTDAGHSDAPGNTFTDHGDYNPPSNTYTAHIDNGYGHWDYTSSGSYWHSDISGPLQSGIANPGHTDAVGHTDVPHSDNAHQDTHGDVPHQDTPYVGDHNDHSDAAGGHQDTAHDDVAHGDTEHTDTHGDSHGDSPHYDTPTLIGP